MPTQIFRNRNEAGQCLARRLSELPASDLKNSYIIGLPRGGVPIAYEIAKHLNRPLDILMVRKIGHPRFKEYGIGAVVEGGFSWLNPKAIGSDISADVIQEILEKEKVEISRRVKKYRHGRVLSSMKGKTIIFVDDGLATGVSAKVAAHYAKSQGAKKVIFASPVCSYEAAKLMRDEVDQVICLNEEKSFIAVGHFYLDFPQLTDAEVMRFLEGQETKENQLSF